MSSVMFVTSTFRQITLDWPLILREMDAFPATTMSVLLAALLIDEEGEIGIPALFTKSQEIIVPPQHPLSGTA